MAGNSAENEADSYSAMEIASMSRKMKVLAAEMDLIQEFVNKTFGVRILNIDSKYFKDLHTRSCSEMEIIRNDLDFQQSEGRQEEEVGIGRMKSVEIKQEKEQETSGWDLESMGNSESNGEDEPTAEDQKAVKEVVPNYENVEDTMQEKVQKHQQRQRRRIRIRSFQCQFCPKSFTTKCVKDRHEKTHSGERPFPCRHCGKNFTQIGHRNTHERTHTKEKPYKCGYCKAHFSHSSNKKLHERTHTDERPFVCKYCGKRFNTLFDKERHHRIHTGEKPYICEICGVSFRQAGHLAGHKRTHQHCLA